MTANAQSSQPQTAIEITNALLRHPKIAAIIDPTKSKRTPDWTNIDLTDEKTELGAILKGATRVDYQTSWVGGSLTTSIIIGFEKGQGPNGIEAITIDGLGGDKIKISYDGENFPDDRGEMTFLRERDSENRNTFELVESSISLGQRNGSAVKKVIETGIRDTTSGYTSVSISKYDASGNFFDSDTIEARDDSKNQQNFMASRSEEPEDLKNVDQWLDKIAGTNVPTETLGSLTPDLRRKIGLPDRTATISF